MKKNLFTLLLTACAISAFVCLPNYAKAQTATISTENFDDGSDPPDNMTYGAGNDDWIVDDGTQSSVPNSSGYSGASGNYFLLADDGDGNSELETVTYTVSTKAFSNISLRWGAFTSNDIAGSGAGSFPAVTLKYSTDGVTYTTISYNENAINDTWKVDSVISLPAGASNANVLYLRWQYNSDQNDIYYAIDDIQLSGTVNTYFSKSSGSLDVLTNWGTNFDGSGTSPTNFTAAGIIYEIVNNPSPTIGSAWTVSGTGSRVVVGDVNTVPSINFTIPSGAVFTGTVDVQNNSTLTIQNATSPTLGSLSTGSTINYAISGAQNIIKATYSNLIVSGSGAKAMPNGTVIINGILNISVGTIALNSGLSAGVTLNGSITGAGTITGTGGTSSQLDIFGSGSFGTITFTPGSQSLPIFKISRSGTFTVTLGSDVTVTKTFEHDNAGILDLNGHTLTVNATSLLLSISGAATISGSSTSNLSLKATGTTSGSLYMTQTSSSTSSLSSLLVNSSLTLGNALNIIDSIVPKSGALTTGGNLTLIADQTTVGHTGRIGVVTGSISGNVVSQVYHSPPTNNTDWRLMGVAGISNATFSAWGNEFPMSCPTCPYSTLKGTAFSSITTYNEAAQSYPDITYSGTIAPGAGYWVYLGTASPGTSSAPILISVMGTAQTGAVGVSITETGSSTYSGDNLVANPYASPISFPKLYANNSSHIANSWYTYSPAYGDNAAYVAGVSTPSYSTGIGIDATIPAGMGFFVVSDTTIATLNFIEALKTSGSNEELLRESNANKVQTALTYFRMQMNGANMFNEAVVRFDPNATAGYDPNFDLYDAAPGTAGWLQISSSSLGQAYSVNSLPDLTQNYSIPVTITCGTTGQYTFTAADLQNMPSGICMKLHDKYSSTDYNVTQGPFNLTISDTETVSRFVLNITVTPLSITANAKQASCNNSNDGLITVVGNNAGPWNYTWKNAGGTVIKTSLNKATPDSLTGLNDGVYSVDVTTVGSCDVANQTFTITAPAAPASAFTAPLQVNIGSNVNLTNNSANATNYIWNFGDGNMSSLQNPTYAYQMPGTYVITLSAINANCNDTTKSTQTIKVDATTGIKQANTGNGDINLSRDISGNYLQFDYANQTTVSIIVYNVLGQVLLNNASLHVINDRVYLNITDNNNQVLYVTITNLNTNQQTTKKFVNN
jgi:PKD repeat protein